LRIAWRLRIAGDCQIELAQGTEKTDHAPIAETVDKEAGPRAVPGPIARCQMVCSGAGQEPGAPAQQITGRRLNRPRPIPG